MSNAPVQFPVKLSGPILQPDISNPQAPFQMLGRLIQAQDQAAREALGE
jgi:hypothetical protein